MIDSNVFMSTARNVNYSSYMLLRIPLGTVESVAVEYYNWDKQTGNNIPGYCMYISSNGGKWRSQLCNSTTDVSYFVCEKGKCLWN